MHDGNDAYALAMANLQSLVNIELWYYCRIQFRKDLFMTVFLDFDRVFRTLSYLINRIDRFMAMTGNKMEVVRWRPAAIARVQIRQLFRKCFH